MRDCNGRELKVGDQFFTYRDGICTVTMVKEEDGYYIAKNPNGSFGYNENILKQECPEIFKVRPWHEMAKEALAVQDACNLVAVVDSFHTIVKEVKARLESEGKGGTEAVWQHPICILFSSKISSLTASESPTIFYRAYEWAKSQT